MRLMPSIRPLMAAALAASVTAAVPLAQQAANAVTVPLTDAARVASLRLSLHSGNVIVRGSNRRDIAVSSSGADAAQDRRRADAPAGLRRLGPDAEIMTQLIAAPSRAL